MRVVKGGKEKIQFVSFVNKYLTTSYLPASIYLMSVRGWIFNNGEIEKNREKSANKLDFFPTRLSTEKRNRKF
jgi:hypothetical protein